jgi:hypothetical protein
LTNRRRKANQAFEAVEKERAAKMHFADFYTETPPPPPPSNPERAESEKTNSAILEELGALRKAVESLTQILANTAGNKEDNSQ